MGLFDKLFGSKEKDTVEFTVDNTDIYLKILLVNNQEAINYNDNIYYIYNNKVIINNQEFNCYDRCCIYNDGSENDTIVPIQYFNVSNENTEIFNNVNYGYLNNEGNIQLIDINSATSISYKIVLPTYQSFSSKNGEIILWEYELTDILVYNNSNFSYSRATVQSYYSNKTLNNFWEDSTRLPEFYDGTYEYLKEVGIEEI